MAMFGLRGFFKAKDLHHVTEQIPESHNPSPVLEKQIWHLVLHFLYSRETPESDLKDSELEVAAILFSKLDEMHHQHFTRSENGKKKKELTKIVPVVSTSSFPPTIPPYAPPCQAPQVSTPIEEIDSLTQTVSLGPAKRANPATRTTKRFLPDSSRAATVTSFLSIAQSPHTYIRFYSVLGVPQAPITGIVRPFQMLIDKTTNWEEIFACLCSRWVPTVLTSLSGTLLVSQEGGLANIN